jgi:hypothetical protein
VLGTTCCTCSQLMLFGGGAYGMQQSDWHSLLRSTLCCRSTNCRGSNRSCCFISGRDYSLPLLAGWRWFATLTQVLRYRPATCPITTTQGDSLLPAVASTTALRVERHVCCSAVPAALITATCSTHHSHQPHVSIVSHHPSHQAVHCCSQNEPVTPCSQHRTAGCQVMAPRATRLQHGIAN